MNQSAIAMEHRIEFESNEDKKFWLDQLQGNLNPTLLRLDFNRPEVNEGHYQTVQFQFDTVTSDRLAHLTGEDPFLTYTALMAVWSICFYRYSKQSTIIIGSPVLQTDASQIEAANAVAIVNHIGEELIFKEYLLKVRDTLINAYQHQKYPIERLAADLGVAGISQYCGLFQTTLEYPGLHQPLSDINQDMAIGFSLHESHYQGTIRYNADLFRAATIHQFGQVFQAIMAQVLHRPELAITELILVNQREAQQILDDWNRTATAYPVDTCLHQLFEDQVARHPDAIALQCGESVLTYQELNQRANQLGHYLRSKGIGPNQAVGLLIDRSIEMIIGLLGVLKAGGAYVPIDPAYPRERIAMMLNAMEFRAVLTRTELTEQLPAGIVQPILLDRDWPEIGTERTENLTGCVTVADLCYIIFTSGSTGTPKAAAVHHQGWTNLLYWFSQEFAISEPDRGLIISSFSFDITQRAIAMPLINGGQLHLLASPFYDQDLILQTIAEQQITLLNCAPSTFYPLIENRGEAVFDKLTSLRCLFLGGEAISANRLQHWVESPQCRAVIANVYGAAECSDVSSFYRLRNYQEYIRSSVPIGKPIFNTQVYILDEALQPVPVGVIGEICLAGIGVGKGYRNDPELTARKFVRDPFAKDPGAKLYRTGDLGRFLSDGNIEFNGRVDHQVKIRGLRIELGDIESVIRQYEIIREVVVLDQRLDSGDQYLVAYLIPETTPDANESLISEVRHFVKGKLPAYMVPNFFVILDAIPLNPNGKIDRKALPQPANLHNGPHSDEPDLQENFKLTQLEQELVTVYATTLGQTKVAIDDNFFEIGGHSLMATQVISLLNEKLRIQLSLADLLTAPTVAGLAKRIERKLQA